LLKRWDALLTLRRTIDSLIYLSVALGIVLLPQLYVLVPTWLFYSVLGGWLAYVVVAILAATGRRIAYPLAFVLSVLTLAVSLPQPEHQSFVKAGLSLASLTFLVGSAFQLALLILIPVYLRERK
jgi:hypothetical protein